MNKASIWIGIVTGGLAILAALGTVAVLFIKAEVASQLKDAGIPSTDKITAMESGIKMNTDDIHTIEDRWNRLVDALAAE